jgi:phospholipase/carboxylesterase
VIAVWRPAARNPAYAPLVVLLHGRGADEHDLLGAAERLPGNFNYVSLRGPVSAEGGYTWFENRGVARPIAASLRASVDIITAWLDETPRGRPCFLFGFSAGMMMAGALLLAAPERFAGGILLSGAVAFDCGIGADDGRLSGLPVFYGRGLGDTMIPATLVARTAAYLRERSGAQLTERTYDHGHLISQREIHDIGKWLAESC